MKKLIITIIFIISLIKFNYSQDDIIQYPIKASASVNTLMSFVNIYPEADKSKDYLIVPGSRANLDLAFSYKNFSISHSFHLPYMDLIMGEEKNIDSKTTASYYGKKWGGDILINKLTPHVIPPGTVEKYSNTYDPEFDNYIYAGDVVNKAQIINIYRVLWGNKPLYDYFCQPIVNKKSKFGIYNQASFRRNVFDIPKRAFGDYNYNDLRDYTREDFGEILSGFNSTQAELSLGVGMSYTLFLFERLYISGSNSYGLTINKMNNTIINQFSNLPNEGFKDVYFGLENLNGQAYIGYVGKLFEFQIGGLINRNIGHINDNYSYNNYTQYLYYRLVFHLDKPIPIFDKVLDRINF